MRTFKRTESRQGFEDQACWQKGYTFTTNVFNMVPALGACYAWDEDTKTRHDMTSLEAVEA